MRVMACAAVLLIVLGTSACGADGGGPRADASGTAQIRVTTIPVADAAPLYLGVAKGFFRDERLDVTINTAQGGAEIIPALLNGSVDFGFGNTLSQLLANAKGGIQIRTITQGAPGAGEPSEAWSGVVTRGDSPIRTAKDLEGKTVALNALNNTFHLATLAAVDKLGADPSKVKFIEIPYPELNAALESHRVDTISSVDPFLTKAKDAKQRVLFGPLLEMDPGLTLSTYFTTADYVKRNPDVVRRFQRAMNRSLEYARAHPGEARSEIAKYTEIPAPVLERITLAPWTSDLNRASIELTGELGVKYGLLDGEPNVDDLLSASTP